MENQVQLNQENNQQNLKHRWGRVIAAGAFALSAGGVLAACGSSNTATQKTFTMSAKKAGEGTQNCSKGEAVYPLLALGPLEFNNSLEVINAYITKISDIAGGFKNHTVHYDKNQGTFTYTYNTSNSASVQGDFDLKFTPSPTSKLPAINLAVNTGLYNLHISNALSCYKNGEQYTTVYDQGIIKAYESINKMVR